MTFAKNLSYRNLNINFFLVILYLLLAIIFTKASPPLRHARDETCITTESTAKAIQEAEVKENSEIASLIAIKAAQEAKEASNAQSAAGAEAALEVKEELAERAEDAARAAQAALAGKQAVVDELEQQIKQDEMLIHEQSEAQQRISQTAKDALDAAKQMKEVGKNLKNFIQVAEQAGIAAEAAALEIEKEADSKCSLIEIVRQRLKKLVGDLKDARTDLDKTLDAAKEAVDSAKTAEQNAEDSHTRFKRKGWKRVRRRSRIRR